MESGRPFQELSSHYRRLLLVLVVAGLLFVCGNGGVAAQQTTESTGPGGYGWQQVYGAVDWAAGEATRITGSADRQFYDYGFKGIQISGRKENYWSRDSGWWYVSSESTLNFTLYDGDNHVVLDFTDVLTSKGVATVNYTWGTGSRENGVHLEDERGRWTAVVGDGTLTSMFYLYVRGHLKVTPTTSSITPSTGDTVTINASVRDQANNLINRSAVDNIGNSTVPQVTAIVTGAGEYFDLVMYDDGTKGGDTVADDGVWSAQFTPQNMGDHKIIVRATDGHNYWVDGRGRTTLSVSGDFPYGSLGLSLLQARMGTVADKFGSLFLAFALFFGLGLIAVAKRRGEHG